MAPPQRAITQFEEGRSATASELRFRLAGAGDDFLQGALLNPLLDEHLVVALLENRGLTAGLIQRIAAHKKWLASYAVQRGLVLHPNTARGLKLNLLHFLRWRDLTWVAEDPQSPAPVKRSAETLIASRLSQMALGEKVALARIATPGVIPILVADAHPDVVTALLGNPRLVEEQVLLLCLQERIAPEALSAVGRSRRWGGRYPVRLALLRHPHTPAAISLRFLDSLLAADLREIAGASRVPRLVRSTAVQVLRLREGSVDRSGGVS